MDLLQRYQEFCKTTEAGVLIGWSHQQRLLYFACGLVEEAAEVAGKIKHLVRDSDGIPDDVSLMNVIKELGDVCWYQAQICNEFSNDGVGIPLAYIFEHNIEKLSKRLEKGTIQGSGDDR